MNQTNQKNETNQKNQKDRPNWPNRPNRLNIFRGAPMTAFLKELWAFMQERKKFWLLPIILVLLVFGALLVLTEGSAVAPFIYTLF